MKALCYLVPWVFIGIVAITPETDSAWWYFSQYDPMILEDHGLVCDLLPYINKRQRHICSRNPDLIEVIGRGIRNGISECQFQFRYQKWNCSTFTKDSSLFGKTLTRGGTREIAFVQAMHSASAIYHLARTCSRGHPKCGCALQVPNGRPTNMTKFDGQFKWDGCDQVVKFSTNFVRRFTDAAEPRISDGKAKFTLHNNRVGRIIIRKKLRKVCKCHGVSSSCVMKTCWSTLPSFREIGDALREKYDAGVEVTFKPSGRMIPVQKHHKKPTKRSLVYYEPSPDYCKINFSKGAVGTRNRLCQNTSEGEESCDILCCKEKFETTVVQYSEKCECSFTWCCEIRCQVCNVTRVEYRCRN